MKYEGATGMQACVSVMVWLTFVILKKVAVVSSGETVTPVIPKNQNHLGGNGNSGHFQVL